jgi:hypothetical protein
MQIFPNFVSLFCNQKRPSSKYILFVQKAGWNT